MFFLVRLQPKNPDLHQRLPERGRSSVYSGLFRMVVVILGTKTPIKSSNFVIWRIFIRYFGEFLFGVMALRFFQDFRFKGLLHLIFLLSV